MTSIRPDSSVSTVITQRAEDRIILILFPRGRKTFIVPKVAQDQLSFLFCLFLQE